MKKLILKFGKWMSEEEFKKLKKDKRAYNKFRRNLNKSMSGNVDYDNLEKTSKESGFPGVRHHYVGKRSKRIKQKNRQRAH